MSSEGNLQTSKEQLEAQKRISKDENETLKKQMHERDGLYKVKENEMA